MTKTQAYSLKKSTRKQRKKVLKMNLVRFWTDNAFCLRWWKMQKAQETSRLKKDQRIIRYYDEGVYEVSPIPRLMFLYMLLPIFVAVAIINIIIAENKNHIKLIRGSAIFFSYAVSCLLCRFIVFPLTQLALIRISINPDFYTRLETHRQTLYSISGVCNQPFVIKFFILLISVWLLIVLLKVIVEQIFHLFCD